MTCVVIVRLCRIFDEIGGCLQDNSGMNKQSVGLRVAGGLFAFFAVIHVVRIVERLEVRIGGNAIPMWASVLGAVVGGSLSAWFLILAKRGAGS